MKRFIKIALIIVVVLLAIGIILAAVGKVMFGVRVFRDGVYRNNDGWGWGLVRSVSETNDWDDDWEDDDWDDDEWNMAQETSDAGTDSSHHADSHNYNPADALERGQDNFSDTITDSCMYAVDAGSITEVDLSFGAAEVNILPLESGMSDNQIVLKINPESRTLELRKEGAKLELEDRTKSTDWTDINTVEVKMYVPKKAFDHFELDISAGAMSIETDVEAREMDLEVAAGEIDASGVLATTNSLDVYVGAGTVHLSEIHASGKVDMCVDMGELVVDSGELLADADLECNTGEMSLTFNGSEEDYNYDLENSMGSITLNSHSYDGISKEYQKNNHASWTIEAECNMGEISLKIK